MPLADISTRAGNPLERHLIRRFPHDIDLNEADVTLDNNEVVRALELLGDADGTAAYTAIAPSKKRHSPLSATCTER